MKIIIPFMATINFHDYYNGGAKYVYYLSKYLAKKGVDVTIITTKLKNSDKKEIIKDGVRYIFLPIDYMGNRLIKYNVPYKLLFSYCLNRYLEKIGFDILHSHEALALFYLMKKNRKSVIMQCHGLEPFYGPESLSQKGLRRLYVKLFLQKPWLYCLKNSDVVGSEEKFQTPSIIKLGVKKEQIVPFPNGIDLERINELRTNYNNKRKELGVKKDDLLILNVNQITPDKRVEDIVNAFALIKKEIKNAKLIIIGKGVSEGNVYRLINKLKLKKDIVHLKDISEKELYDYYFSSDLFMNASIQYDFIVGIQEAMACGLPIVSSGQDFLVKQGINGYVVGIMNHKELANRILKIWRNKKLMKKMGKESKKLIKEYDYNNITKLAIREYKKLLKKRI